MTTTIQYALSAATEEAVSLAEMLSEYNGQGRVAGGDAQTAALPAFVHPALELIEVPVALRSMLGGMRDGFMNRG